MMTIHESFTSKIGIISYLTALKNRSNEMDATDILFLTGQGNGNGNMEVIGLRMYLGNKIRLNMF